MAGPSRTCKDQGNFAKVTRRGRVDEAQQLLQNYYAMSDQHNDVA
jgi:hypothetical protein